MVAIRQVDGVSILDWKQSGSDVPPLASDIKTALESGDVTNYVLVNMSACLSLRADYLEALSQALTVCQDRSCSIGLYRVPNEFARLVEVSGLTPSLPPLLGSDEAAAIHALQNGGTAEPELAFETGAPEPELEFEMPEPAPEPAAPETAPTPNAGDAAGSMEFEIDLTPGPGAPSVTAPTARFDPATLSGGSSATPGAAQPTPESQADSDLLLVYWADLASQGYAIGGDGADSIMEAVASDPSTPSTSAMKAVDDGVLDIDLGDAAPIPDARRGYVTEKMPVFSLDEDATWSAKPTGTVQVEFDTGQGQRLSAEPAGVFGAQVGGGDYSPVGAPTSTPPAVQAQNAISDADETVMIQPGALEAALMQAGLGAPAAAPAPAAEPAPASASPDDGSDQTVMFQPGALDAALLAEVAKAAGPPVNMPAPALEPPPEAPTPFSDLPEGEQELKQFLRDYAITSNLHVQVLERFVSSRDTALGRAEVQQATGAGQGAVTEVIDQLVQSRLIKRTRSMRVRGGSGFLFSTSPRLQGAVIRLLRMWADPGQRTKVSGWLQS